MSKYKPLKAGVVVAVLSYIIHKVVSASLNTSLEGFALVYEASFFIVIAVVIALITHEAISERSERLLS